MVKAVVIARGVGAARSIGETLRELGVEVVGPFDRAAALAAWSGDHPSLAVLSGPGLEGLCAEVRRLWGQAPWILAVADGEERPDPAALVAAGVSDFSIDGAELDARLALAVARIIREEGSAGRAQAVVPGAPSCPKNAGDSPGQGVDEPRLLAAERLACMGSLAACIAHEINNLLTYVIGNLDYAARGLGTLVGTADGDRARGVRMEMAIADVREGVERIRGVAQDLRSFSEPELGVRGPLDVRRVLDVSIKLASNEIRHRARLERRFLEVPPVRASAPLLQQVFLRLLLETARSIPEGSAQAHTIVIATGIADDGRIVVELSEAAVALAVRLGRAALPGGEGADRQPWLVVCETIVASLGGELFAGPPEAPGFRVVLPRTAELDEPSPEPPPKPTPIASLRGGDVAARILVVDDEPVIAATIRRALEPYDVYIVTSGRDALELCRGQHFDLVLCDLMMPDLTGMDLYEALSHDGDGVEQRIIFMTGGAFTERAQRFARGVPSIDKPFGVDELLMVVHKYFGRPQKTGG